METRTTSQPFKKRCSLCGDTKTADAFHKRTASKDGLYHACKTCRHPPGFVKGQAERLAAAKAEALAAAKRERAWARATKRQIARNEAKARAIAREARRAVRLMKERAEEDRFLGDLQDERRRRAQQRDDCGPEPAIPYIPPSRAKVRAWSWSDLMGFQGVEDLTTKKERERREISEAWGVGTRGGFVPKVEVAAHLDPDLRAGHVSNGKLMFDLGASWSLARSPEHQLMLTLLERGILDAANKARGVQAGQLGKGTDPEQARWFDNSLAWLEETESLPCNFPYICDTLGLNMDAIREKTLDLCERARMSEQ